jgi:hypothetical protein
MRIWEARNIDHLQRSVTVPVNAPDRTRPAKPTFAPRMKNLQRIHDLRRLRTTLATIIFLALSACVFALSSTWQALKGTGSLAMVGALATVYVGLLNYWLQRDNVMQGLFTAFNARYDKLNDGLMAIAKGQPLEPGVDPERIIVDYLNLCAEEYFWYLRGRIDKDIWRAWQFGMNEWMKVPAIRTIAKQEAAAKDSYYGLFSVLELE